MDKNLFYYKMLLIRKVEEKVEELFSLGLLRGTTHCSRGQEAVAIGLLSNIDCKKDFVTGNHRSHGHYLALNPDPYPFFAELMGKKTGLVKGKGGSQHISFEKFYTNGITGGMVPVAAGLAFYQKRHTTDGICISIFGDGAINEGYVLEALNLAAVMELPILFVLENNNYAMSTSFAYANKGKIEDRVKGFGLPYFNLKATDVNEVYAFSKEIVGQIRTRRKPAFVEFETHRQCGHSKSDKREYVSKELDTFWTDNDPVELLKNQLEQNTVSEIQKEVDYVIADAVKRAMNDPYPEPSEVFLD